MVEGYEIIVLILGFTALVVILLNWEKLQQLPSQKILIAAFLMFLASWILTNVEALLWRDALNILEHISQATGGIMIAFWSWEVFWKAEDKR